MRYALDGERWVVSGEWLTVILVSLKKFGTPCTVLVSSLRPILVAQCRLLTTTHHGQRSQAENLLYTATFRREDCGFPGLTGFSLLAARESRS